MSSLSLRPDHSLTILSDGFVSQLHPFRFLHECDSSYGVLTFAPAGLTPAEQTSLRWTHWVANSKLGQNPSPSSVLRSAVKGAFVVFGNNTISLHILRGVLAAAAIYGS